MTNPRIMTTPMKIHTPVPSRQAGYSLIEAIIALAIAVVLIVVVLNLFDLNRRMARLESEQIEMQQAVRAVHLEVASRARVAGRGGLIQGTAAKPWPDQGVVVEVASNVQGPARQVAPAMADSPVAVAGTDVLTLRGVLTGDILYGYDDTEDRTYLVLRDDLGQVTAEPADVRSGEIHLCEVGPAGFAQSLEPLRAAIAAASEEALMLAGTGGEEAYAVVKLDPGASEATSAVCDPGNPAAGVKLAFVVSGDGGRADAYHALSPSAPAAGLPPGLTSVAYAGLVEEYRYYVREVREVAADDGSALSPRLSRARLYPNTGQGWGADAATVEASLAEDVADDVVDLQVSLGMDSAQGGGSLEDGSLPAGGEPIFESEDGEADDWLFNHPSDDPRDDAWARPGTAVLARPWLRSRLQVLRLTTVGRAAFPISQYEAPLLDRVGDRVYDPNDPDDPDSDVQRRFRRWVLSTTIDLRNL
jgi:type II secretory pathway pseudopilin PulG